MKKRVLAILLASAVLMISGCGRDTIPDRETSSGNKESVTTSSESNIEEESVPLNHQDEESTGYQIMNTTWENQLVEYTGDYIEENFQIVTSPKGEEFTLFVYIDGVRTPYYSSEDEEVKDYQLFRTTDDKLMKDISIYFKPVEGKKGEIYDLNIVLINNPEYMLKDTSWVSFMPYLTCTCVCAKQVRYNYDDELIEMSDNYDIYELDKNMENQFIGQDGKNSLDVDGKIWFTYCTEPFDYNSGFFPTFDYLSADKNGTLDFYIPILGNDSEYVFSVYINNEIVPAFDGKEYLDVKVKRDKYIERKVSIPVDKYSGLNKIYVVAVRKNDNFVNKGWTCLLEVK